MLRGCTTRLAAAALALVVCTGSAAAQNWNAAPARALAERVVARRQGQLSDNVVESYRAKAKGFLTFLGQFGDTALIPPFVMKVTQIATDVYWRAPSFSKQIVVGRRDTLLSPGDIDFYADRFGIVQANFPDRIRLGDGRDVADVMHPFSAGGLDAYDFAITDSLTYASTSLREPIAVYEVRYRPRDPSQPRAIGSAYVDKKTGDIVRLDLTFTKSALLDKRNEMVSVALENALIEQGAWLPRRQQIEVVRAVRILGKNVRGIVRGAWEVGEYDLKFAPPPAMFRGRAIEFSPPDSLRAYKFDGTIVNALPPDIIIPRDEDVKRIQRMAEELVEGAFREETQRASLSFPHIGDVIRVTRAEGLSFGAGAVLAPSAMLDIDVRGRYGFADNRGKIEVGVRAKLSHARSVRFFALRDNVDVRDVPEGSVVRNTFAAQEFGTDATDPIDVGATGVQIALGRIGGVRWSLEVSDESHRALAVRTTPEHGAYEPLIAADSISGERLTLRGDGIAARVAGGTLTAGGELRLFDFRAKGARFSADLAFERKTTHGTLALRTTGAALSNGRLGPQFFAYLGGPTTGPGYSADAFGARRAIAQRVEWRTEIPFLSMGLSRFGALPGRATLAPYVHAVFVDDPVRGSRQGWYPAIGVGLSPVMSMVRLDVARGLRDGRWTLSIDMAKILWPIM